MMQKFRIRFEGLRNDLIAEIVKRIHACHIPFKFSEDKSKSFSSRYPTLEGPYKWTLFTNFVFDGLFEVNPDHPSGYNRNEDLAKLWKLVTL